MKRFTTTIFLVGALVYGAIASGHESDTVVITLENESKVVIYTKDKNDLRDIEKYDINKMIKDLNRSLSKSDTTYLELTERRKNDYIRDTTIVYQEGDKTANIRLGNIEFSVDGEDIDDWDDVEDEWERDDFKKYSYVDRHVDRTRNYFNVEFGTNNWLEDGSKFPGESNEPYSVRPWGSWYWGLANVNKTWIGGPLFLDWGFGISFYNWKLDDNRFQVIEGDQTVEFVRSDTLLNINPEKSKLAATYINFTMVPMFDFVQGRRKIDAYERGPFRVTRSKRLGFRMGVGGYAGYRLGSRSKYVYKEDGDKEKDINKDNFYLSNFRYGVRLQMGYKGIDFFANYDLNEVFASGRGPSLNAISFGLVF